MEEEKVSGAEVSEKKAVADEKAPPLPKKFIILAVVAVVCVICSVFRGRNETHRDVFYGMDTTVTLKLWGDKNNDYKKLVEKLEGLFDCYDKDSEIYKLNKNGEAKLSKETLGLLKEAKALCEKYPECDITSGGIIDLWDVNGEGKIPTDEEISKELLNIGIENLTISDKKATLIKGKINLGSVAKGYACDLLKKKFDKNEVECAIVSFGSSSLMYGEKPDGEKFSVGVNNPLDKDKNLGTLSLTECFVSTSGGYERFFERDGEKYCHIIDLSTGKPVKSDLLSVTVIGQSGIETDFLSTCIYIKGEAGLDEFFKREDISLVVVTENKEIVISEELKGDFSLKDESFTVIYR